MLQEMRQMTLAAVQVAFNDSMFSDGIHRAGRWYGSSPKVTLLHIH